MRVVHAKGTKPRARCAPRAGASRIHRLRPAPPDFSGKPTLPWSDERRPSWFTGAFGMGTIDERAAPPTGRGRNIGFRRFRTIRRAMSATRRTYMRKGGTCW